MKNKEQSLYAEVMAMGALIGISLTLGYLLRRFRGWINQHDLTTFYEFIHQEWVCNWIAFPLFIISLIPMTDSVLARNAKYNIARFALMGLTFLFVSFQVRLEPFMLVSYSVTVVVIYAILCSAANDADARRSYSSYNVEVDSYWIENLRLDLVDSLELQSGKPITVTLKSKQE